MAWCNDATQIVCCAGATCLTVKKCKCTCLGGTQAPVATCGMGSCQDFYRRNACYPANYCACIAAGRRWDSTTPEYTRPCDCRRALYACVATSCEECDYSTGYCTSTCPYPRQCCRWQNGLGSTCCPVTQTCQGFQCVDKCTAPTKYCPNATGGHTCCAADQKCCPNGSCCEAHQDCCPDGCRDSAPPFTIQFDIGINRWTFVPHPGPLTAGQYVDITAYGIGGAPSPDGVGICCPGQNIDDSISHFALIGKVSLDGSAPTSGPYTYIGARGGIQVETGGRLLVRHNGVAGTGQYVVTITIRGCNPAVAAAFAEAITYEATAQAGDSVTPPPRGPGTELKALLRYVGIVATPNCSCNQRAAHMDEMEAREPGWCLAHMEEILDWLQEQAQERKLPFIRSAAKLLVKRAISNAKRKSAARGNNK